MQPPDLDVVEVGTLPQPCAAASHCSDLCRRRHCHGSVQQLIQHDYAASEQQTKQWQGCRSAQHTLAKQMETGSVHITIQQAGQARVSITTARKSNIRVVMCAAAYRPTSWLAYCMQQAAGHLLAAKRSSGLLALGAPLPGREVLALAGTPPAAEGGCADGRETTLLPPGSRAGRICSTGPGEGLRSAGVADRAPAD